MSGSIWLPGMIVLLAGLAAGWLITRKLAGRSRREQESRNVELRIADLEERRDDLLTVLRERPPRDPSEREALESAAARTMMGLDAAREELGEPRRKKREKRAGDEAVAAPQATPRPFLVGFAYGAGLFLLLGALLYWALRDAQPRPDEMEAAPVAEHPEAPELPPQLAARVVQLQGLLEREPRDLDARSELAYIYLSGGRSIDAFRQAEAIAEIDPENPNGLHVKAVVRLAMGQVDQAAALLAQALTADPTHVDSLYTTGVIALQQGDYEQAIAALESAREASPESSPLLERMLADARAGRSPGEIFGEAAGSQPQPESAAAPTAPVSGPAYRIRIEAAPALRIPPGAVVFVSIRSADTGPPTAARRIDRPSFPLEVALTADHSMMGQPLPEAGILDVRLDADGSAATTGPDDASSRTAARIGETVRVVLSN